MKCFKSAAPVVPAAMFIAVALLAVGFADAFVPPVRLANQSPLQVRENYSQQKWGWGTNTAERQSHDAIRRQRSSVASVQTMGLFGLGAPEIAIILVAAAFVLGPQKLAEFGKDAGKMAGEYGKELKNVPEEFKKGYDETSTDIRARKAKEMDPLPEEIKGSDE